jgi:hypothetical protein
MSDNSSVNNDNIVTSNSSSYSFEYFYDLFNNNKTYIIIGICGLLILYIVYYLFFTNDIKPKKMNKPILPMPGSNKSNNKEIEHDEECNLEVKEYIILDKEGNPEKVSNNFFNKLNLNNDNNILKSKLNNIKSNFVTETKHNENNSRKLFHPNNSSNNTTNDNNDTNDDNNDTNNDNNESSEIDYELANMKIDENSNIKAQNLTNSEIEDINNKLNMIK